MRWPTLTRESAGGKKSRERVGGVLLLLAGASVGIAIATSGAVSRAINGVSGVVWIAAALVLLSVLRDDPRFWRRLLLVAVIGIVLVVLVRPSDLVLAIAGFGLAGAVIAAIVPERSFTWAMLLPALWLPEHLLYAVGRSVYRSARDLPAALRSDPPPTAALVPLAMIVAAMAGAWLARRFLEPDESGADRSWRRYREMVRSRSRS